MSRPANVVAILLVLLALCIQATTGQPPALAQEDEPAPERSSEAQAEDDESSDDEADGELQPASVPGELIIRFQPGTTDEEIAAFYQEYNLREEEDLNGVQTESDDTTASELKLAATSEEIVPAFVSELMRDPRVVYAEPNYLLTIVQSQPDDPMFGEMWALHNTGQTGGTAGVDIDALAAWEFSTGSDEIIVGVIDTGVDWEHEDLADNMWVNPVECPDGYGECDADGVDDDNNGYVDDFYGINAITDAGDPMDDYGHGTHVAGTIGAVGNNGTGVIGVNHTVRIVGCKFLSASGGGSTSDAIKCFNYFDNLKNEQGYNILVTNNSWGGGGESQALKDAMAGPDAPLHACAAGNSNTDQPHFPASYDLENIVSVAATDHNDMYASFSNYGTPHVDLAAPGDDILSTLPTGSCPLCDPSGYGLVSGTSMATPHVAGAAALIWSVYDSLTPVQVKQRIMAGIEPLDDLSKTTLTNGRLNLLNTLEEDETPPAAVSNLSVAANLLTGARLTWTATGDDGNTGTAQAYDIRYSDEPITEENFAQATPAGGEPVPSEAGTQEEFLLSGLDPESTYYVAMKVLDNVGNASPLSNVVTVNTNAGTVIFEDDMEDGEGDWVVQGTDDLWHITEHRSNSPTHAWYYGIEDSWNYDTGDANSGTLTSPPIELGTSNDALLTFYEWSELESSENFDTTEVQVSTDGNTWETVFSSHGTEDQWIKRTVGLASYIGDASTLYIRFAFDTVDDKFNNFEGWYIDDVQVLTAQQTVPGQTEEEAPNLVLQESNIGLSNSNPSAGELVTVQAVVFNHGTQEADDVSVLFVDATGETAVPLGPAQSIANIPVGGSATVQITYDTAGLSGERTLRAIVDPNNFITESSETDNEAQKTLTITSADVPNLVALDDNIGFSAISPGSNEPVTVIATILNTGGAEASDVAVQFIDTTATNPVPIGEPQIIASIPPGGSGIAQIAYDITGITEDRDIGVMVDPNNAIAESDETDNSAEATLELAEVPAPNLVVDAANIGFSTDNPTQGDTVTIYATVRNEGSIEAANVVVQFSDDTDDPLPIGEQQTIELIPPGGSGTVEVTYDTTGKPGDRSIEVVADPYNFIAESSESDNDDSVTLTVASLPAPNLVMLDENIGFTPAQWARSTAPQSGTGTVPPGEEGQTVLINATVLNDGSAPATDVTVQFVDITTGSARPIGEAQTIRSIPAGGSGVAQVSYDISNYVRDRIISVVVDPNNFIPELDEEDNEGSNTLPVAAPPAPNLTILSSNIQFLPTEPGEGDLVTITAIVLNNGSAAAEDILVQFQDISNGGLVPIGTERTIDSIAPGDSATVRVFYDTAGLSGNRRIQVLVDSNNLLDELDENDNEAIETLAVTASPAPNLVVLAENIGFNPMEPVVGDAVTVTVTVLNNGGVAAENVTVQFMDVTGGESGPVGAPQTIESIAPGGSGTATIVYETGESTGDRRIRVMVDPSNFIEESDESDNRATETLTVAPPPAPNLVMMQSNIGFSTLTPTSGEAVTVTATILNNGNQDAEDVLVQFVDVTDGGAETIGEKQTLTRIPAGGIGKASVVYNTRFLAGERRIRVVIDPHSMVPETEEGDNEAINMLSVAPPPAPNLTILDDNLGLNITQVVQGNAISVTAVILNVGTAPANNVEVQFVDLTDNNPVPFAANITIDRILPGESATVGARYRAVAPAGERELGVVVDPSNRIAERSENDNEASVSVDVVDTAAPNLVMEEENIGFSPVQPGSDEPVTIYATVLNRGSADASDIAVQVLDVTDGSPLPIDLQQSIDLIPAGGSASIEVSYDFGSITEDRDVQVRVDPNNTIAESDESDNDATATLEVAELPAPNLVVDESNLDVSDASPTEGDSVTVYATVRNDGSADVENVAVQFSDATGETPQFVGQPQVIDLIPAGSSGSVSVAYDTTGKIGERTLQVTADPQNFIAETSESDNDAEVSLEVMETAAPNLVMLATNIGFNPPNPTDADLVTVHVVVLNRGGAEANDVAVQVTDSSDGGSTPVEGPHTIARIPPGGSGSIEVTYDTFGKEGERTIGVTVDPNNFIAESDENDNAATRLLTVAPPPASNLTIQPGAITFDPPNPGDGDIVTIQAEVFNSGSDDATDVVVRFEEIIEGEAELIGTQQLIDTIEAGTSATAQVTFDTTGKIGMRTIQVTVDPNDTIDESNEDDNIASTVLEVVMPPAPNLVIESGDIEFEPASPVEGDDVTIIATVHNDGEVDAFSVDVQFMDASGSTPVPIGSIQTIDVILTEGTGTAQVEFSADEAGEFDIMVVVDPNEMIAETDEDDNEATATLEVMPPGEEEPPAPEGVNLTVSDGDIEFDPAEPAPGDVVTITFVVENDSAEDAEDVTVHVLDDTDDEPIEIGELVTDTIEAGDSVEMMVTYDTADLEEGERTITVIVDPNDDIDETDEDDNEASATLTLGPPTDGDEPPAGDQGTGAETDGQPNLVVRMGDITFELPDATDGGTVTTVVMVHNEGSRDAVDVPVQFVLLSNSGATPVDAPQLIERIAAGGSVAVRVVLTALEERESHGIGVLVDPEGAIAESNEADNSARAPLQTIDLLKLERPAPEVESQMRAAVEER